MKELHILAKGQSTIPSCKQHFNVSYSKYGSGVIELTRFGEYSLTTSGITDVAARRTAEYKSAYNGHAPRIRGRKQKLHINSP